MGNPTQDESAVDSHTDAADSPSPLGLSPVLWALIAATLCGLQAILDLPGPDRSPRSFHIVRWACLFAAVAGLLLFVYRHKFADRIPVIATAIGTALFAGALGIAPELLDLPTHGIGDRFWGVPTLLGIPVAGVALLLAPTRMTRTLAACGLVWVVAGLLQPVASLGDIQLALTHHWHRIETVDGLAALLLFVVSLFGVAAVWLEGRDPTNELSRLVGWVLVAALPAWEILRLALAWKIGAADQQSTAIAALLLVLGATAWLLAGLQQTLVKDAPLRQPMARFGEGMLVVGLCVLWLFLKSFTWRWSVTDENIYFYDALLMTKGQLPYRDFFFAHPPLHLAIPAVLFSIFGFHLTIAKLIPVVAALVTGLLVWQLVRERLGRLAAVLTLGCFLFAFELLQASTNMNGVNLTSMWLTAGLVLTLRHRWFWAGLLLGCAVTTGVYAIAGVLALMVLSFFHSSRAGLRLAAGFVLVAGGINLVCLWIGGDDFIGGVYRYHGLKLDRDSTIAFLKMLHYHPHLWLGLCLATAVLGWQLFRKFPLVGEPALREERGSFFAPRKLFREPGAGLVKIATLVSATVLIEFTLFKEVYDFYFVLVFPTLAICTGYTIAGLMSAGVHELGELTTGKPHRGLWVVVAFLVVWATCVPLQNETLWAFSGRGWPKELGSQKVVTNGRLSGGKITSRYQDRPITKDKKGSKARPIRGKGNNSEFLQVGEPRDYPWIEPAVWQSTAGPTVRALFWRSRRLRWNSSPGYRRFLWQKSRHVSVADEAGKIVADHSDADETVAGNSSIAPLLALVAHRRVAANMVDTNGKRFKSPKDPRFQGPNPPHHGSELLTLKAFFETICADKIRYLVGSPSGFLSNQRLARLPIVRHYFEQTDTFPDRWAKFTSPGRRVWAITLWRLRDRYADQSPRCAWIDAPSE